MSESDKMTPEFKEPTMKKDRAKEAIKELIDILTNLQVYNE